MAEPTEKPQEDFAETREHEFQDAHYHDEEPDVVNDEFGLGGVKVPANKKKSRRPPLKRHYDED
jgi:hypothetical protein